MAQRTDCDAFDLARDLDPGYGEAFDRARLAGVEAIAIGTKITRDGVEIGREIEIVI